MTFSQSNMKTKGALAAFTLAALFGCGDDDEVAAGELVVAVYGEEFVEEGISAEEMNDGWSVSFERFNVVVEEVTVAGVSASSNDPIDLTVASSGAGHRVATLEVPEGSHTGSSYRLGRINVRGSATKGSDTKRFDWSFDETAQYTACETVTEVSSNTPGRFEVTVHADHLFYDSLVSSEPQVLFQALADADLDGDGEIVEAELKSTGIGGYDPGSEGGIDDMWGWLIAQTTSLGHVDGEGHCDVDAQR